ncbi:MAG: ATP-binding cassette domain-containing protein [Proteobacteria bacterium]|nr:ATP-binding cassette domain-containing protein [Pseudomonadota bacterium]NIS69409.1 ATP-binding cassette domain-containing protein [Pseudomonadota bacterium]
MPKNLRLRDLTKVFGTLVAVSHVDLDVQEGEFVCFLGPSGCGKTTILRMITGFETPTSGEIMYDGKVINDLVPQKRDFGIVFQSYALFPNMTVLENIAFGLKMRRMPRDKITARVDEILNLIGLKDWRNNYPAQLSGGQQQRVALGRALAPNPSVLLLDEPLSALDAKIRVRLRAVIKRLQQELGITMVYVTHDQEEALAIADRVVVMEEGVFKQVGPPIEIYKNPQSGFVADFVGISNFFEGQHQDGIVRLKDTQFVVPQAQSLSDDAVILSIRPEKIDVLDPGKPGKDLQSSNIMNGKIEVVTFLGAVVRILVSSANGEVIVDMVEKDFEQRQLNRGDEVDMYFPPDAFVVYPLE